MITGAPHRVEECSRPQRQALRVWIVNPYGNLPGEGWRDYRSTLLARALEAAGHDIVWWVSNFEHRTKTYRSSGAKDIAVTSQFLIRMVPTPCYSKHISLQRIQYEKGFGREFYRWARACAAPDIIVLAEPALFFSKWVVRLVRQWRVKLVVDILDLWPELFRMVLPQKLRWADKLVFLPWYRRRARLLRQAHAVVAATSDYAQLAKDIVGSGAPQVCYLGVDVAALRRAMGGQAKLPEVLIRAPKADGELWVVYAGTLGENYDIRTILAAGTLLESRGAPVRILIAGEGPLKADVMSSIQDGNLKKVVYIGNLSVDALTGVYARCDIALSTYVEGSTVSMPVKVYDYLAAGLPVINSLGRELGTLVHQKRIGLQYSAQNAESLAGAIIDLLENPDKRLELSRNAKHVGMEFDSGRQYAKFADFISYCANDPLGIPGNSGVH